MIRTIKTGSDGKMIEVVESTEAKSSTEINRTSKGEWSFSVKAYEDDPKKLKELLGQQILDARAVIKAQAAEMQNEHVFDVKEPAKK